MLKTEIEGTLLQADASVIVMQEGEAVATYNRDFYRLPMDEGSTGEPVATVWTKELPVKIEIGLHGILVPA